MRGKPNTQITLTVVRKGDAKPRVVTITRAIIQVQSVKFKLLEPGYAYFRVTQFQEHTGEALVKAIEKLFKDNQGPMKGMVLDLRNDPGGLLTGAVAVSAAFLQSDAMVVYTEGRNEDAKMKMFARPEYYMRGTRDDYLKSLPKEVKSVPMVVLVNGGSASASEIVAGALQDHKRAIIMGTQTFGKGSVQTILPLGNGTAIKLTTARYFTPNGRSIQAKGITPDIVVEEATVTEGEAAIKLREADLDRHLANPQGETPETKSAPQPPTVTPPAAPKPDPKADPSSQQTPAGDAPADVVQKNDYQLNQAVNLLKGLQIIGRK
jgi:carboxyl-terminal processing protease